MRAAVAALAGLALAAPAPAGAAVKLIDVGTFTRPLFVTAPVGDTSRIFVVQQTGQVRVKPEGQAPLAQPFLDLAELGAVTQISSDPANYSERGLLGMAFAPDYAQSGAFYVYYTARGSGNVRIDEFRVSASDRNVADPATRRPVLEIPHGQQGNHNGGALAFGPDGYLYAATGDGGGGGDPANNGQNLDSSSPAVVNGADHHPLLGKLLRIDPRGGAPYAIPPGQPFGAPKAVEIWSYGLRNPFRFSFDRGSGDLVVGDVGQNTWEEIDYVPASAGRDAGRGVNFGWDNREGRHAFAGGSAVNPAGPLVEPVIEHSHGDGWLSIAGGYVVRDPNLPDLAGQYVYGDWGKGKVYAARLATPDATAVRDLGVAAVAKLSSFGEDACARIYVTSLSGPVLRLGDGGDCAGPQPAFPGQPVPGAPAPQPGAADTTPPRVSVRMRSQRSGRTSAVSIHIRCDEQCTVRPRARFRIRRGRRGVLMPWRTNAVRRTLEPGSFIRVVMPIRRSDRAALRRALRRGRVIFANVTVDARDRAGNRTLAQARARLAR